MRYNWTPFNVSINGVDVQANWYDEIRGPSGFSVTYIACTLDVAYLKQNIPDGVPITNVNYNIAEIYEPNLMPQDGYLGLNLIPKLSENQGSSTQVLLWDIDNGRDITCRNAPFEGEFKLSICNKEIADFYDSES